MLSLNVKIFPSWFFNRHRFSEADVTHIVLYVHVPGVLQLSVRLFSSVAILWGDRMASREVCAQVAPEIDGSQKYSQKEPRTLASFISFCCYRNHFPCESTWHPTCRPSSFQNGSQRCSTFIWSLGSLAGPLATQTKRSHLPTTRVTSIFTISNKYHPSVHRTYLLVGVGFWALFMWTLFLLIFHLPLKFPKSCLNSLLTVSLFIRQLKLAFACVTLKQKELLSQPVVFPVLVFLVLK